MAGSVKSVSDLLQIPGNDKCADCGQDGTEWASYSLGVFLCENCAQVHRSLGSHISKVKSLRLDKWDAAQLEFMSQNGNENAKERYEANVPAAYKRPKQHDPLVLREQWIRAKYERQEFVNGSKKQPYLSGRREGPLWKRAKDAKNFQRRLFILDASENTLRYYIKEDAKVAKACLRLDDINIYVVPDKVGNPNGMQIVIDKQDRHVRNIFVYAETPQEMVEWYTAIRAVKLVRLGIGFPMSQPDELVDMINRDFLREGWLHKTGPRAGDAFRRRWFTLDNRRLMYYEDPLDAYPKGEVFIGSKDRGFSVMSGIASVNAKDPGFGFTVKTPERHYHFSADSKQDRHEWIAVINHVVEQPMSPQDSKILYRSSSL